MAADIFPETWYENWVSDGTNITVPITGIGALTPADANEGDGDVREVLFHILNEAFTHQEAIVLDADKPEGMVLARTDAMYASDNNLVQTKFTVTFQRRIDTSSIEPETA